MKKPTKTKTPKRVAKKPSRRTSPKPLAKSKPKAKPAPRRVRAEVIEASPAAPAEPTGGGRAFPIEIDPRQIEASLAKIREEVTHWANKGRYTRVRFKFRGRQLLPDLPLAAVVAAEGLTFYWAGILRPLLISVGAGALLDVELVNDSEKKIAEGKAALLSGDSDKALELFRKAAQMQRDNAGAHLNIGIVLKLRGDHPGAREALQKAKSLDPDGPVGVEADRVLATLPTETAPVPITWFPPRERS